MTKMWIEIRITNAHADQMVSEDLAPTFQEKFIRGERYTDIRFGPLDITALEARKIRDAMDFLYGIKPVETKTTTKPF